LLSVAKSQLTNNFEARQGKINDADNNALVAEGNFPSTDSVGDHGSLRTELTPHSAITNGLLGDQNIAPVKISMLKLEHVLCNCHGMANLKQGALDLSSEK
jgi:hypothetical protein